MDHHELDRERLRMQRLKLRLSQQQLGTQIGHDQGYVSRLERGEITDITVRTLARLADALKVSIDYLMNRTDDPTPPTKRPRAHKTAVG
jgi:transcriptional regulator with XRE-family HTH domain